MKKYDLAILGAGPGGMAAARRAAVKNKKVALINGARIWGHGLHGAYKSKGMYELAMAFRISQKRGWGYIPSPGEVNFEELSQQLIQGTNELENIYLKQLKKLSIDEYRGLGRFVDPHTLAVGDNELSAENIIIATGTRPAIPDHITSDEKFIMTPDLFIRNTRNLKSILILGAGIIGCEFASILHALGVEVHLVDNKPAILNHEDEDIYKFLNHSFNAEGINVYHSSKLLEMKLEKGEKVRSTLDGNRTIITDAALISTGRLPNVESLALENAGVDTDNRGFIPVDNSTRTNIHHIFAVGDVGQRTKGIDMALVHVAEAEAHCAIDCLCEKQRSLIINHIPFIIFTMPMIAGAGMNENEAVQHFPNVRVARYEYVNNHRAHAMRNYEGYVKLIVAPEEDDRILGVRAIGPMADSIIGEVSLLIEQDLPYTKLINMIHAHPSLSESLQSAAQLIEGSIIL